MHEDFSLVRALSAHKTKQAEERLKAGPDYQDYGVGLCNHRRWPCDGTESLSPSLQTNSQESQAAGVNKALRSASLLRNRCVSGSRKSQSSKRTAGSRYDNSHALRLYSCSPVDAKGGLSEARKSPIPQDRHPIGTQTKRSGLRSRP